MSELGLVTFNCCLSVCPPLRYNGAFARANRLADAFYSSIPPETVDVICFQELIVQHHAILKRFIHHKHHTSPIFSSLFSANIRFVHAGLAIASRWPILEEDAYIFTGSAYNAESFMAKAVQYAKIAIPGGPNNTSRILHIFNTHLQAWTTPEACTIREAQTHQMSLFMQRKVSKAALDNNEIPIVMGDLNLDDYEHRILMEKLFGVLNVQFLRPVTPQFSFDPPKNSLVGNDDASEYATWSKKNGCYEEFMTQGVCSCCPRQLIDVIAVHNDSLRQIQHFDTQVIPIKSQSSFEMHVNMSTRKWVDLISDHFAVHSKLKLSTDFPTILQPTISSATRHHNKFYSSAHLGWIIFELVLFVIIFLFLWFLVQLICKRWF